MTDNIFKFINIRPPQRKEYPSGSVDYLPVYGPGSDSVINSRTEANNYIKNVGIIIRLEDLQTPLAVFDRAVVALGPNSSVDTLSKTVKDVFDLQPNDLVAGDKFRADRRKLADSTSAAFFSNLEASISLSHLVRGLRLCELIERIAGQDSEVSSEGGVDRALRAQIVLPTPEEKIVQPLGANPPPITITAGAVKPSGVSDLLIVRQTLRAYELGEIAHVENALKGEIKERTQRRTETTETLLLQETETTTQQEHDLQSTDRFELKSEASKTVSEDLKASAGVTVTGSYGPVTATATGQFAFDRSTEEATKTASSYARDVVERARSSVQQRTLERRSTRTVLEVEETAKHTLDNTKNGGGGTEHIVGVYRWLEKVYEAQIVNYGKRLMLEFYIPEPASYYRAIEGGQALKDLTHKKPLIPIVKVLDEHGNYVDKVLRPELILWPDIQALAATYEGSGLEPEPAKTMTVGASIDIDDTTKFDPMVDAPEVTADKGPYFNPDVGTKLSKELVIPAGYVVTGATWSGHSVARIGKKPGTGGASTSWPEFRALPSDTSVSIGGHTVAMDKKATEVAGFSGTLPLAVISQANGLAITVSVECAVTTEKHQEWQAQVYDAIMLAYHERLKEYEDEAAKLNAQQGIQISGRPSDENRKIEQTELKRSSISILTRQSFDDFGAIIDVDPANDTSKCPKIDFPEAAIEGNIAQYFEQVFEWENMTYIFYPYFWGRRANWPDVLGQESTDPLFTQFLRAGSARVQLPVRPTYEAIVLYFLTSSKLWQESETAPVTPAYLPLIDEIRSQAGDDFIIGKGKLQVQKDKKLLIGTNTQFRDPDDVDREIRINLKVYRIASVESPTSVTLAKRYPGPDEANVSYSLGAVLVGPPWEVRLPTTLVMIDTPNVVLPSWPD